MYPASEIAKAFLCMVDEDSGDLMTNLKLQKLLYYAQGFHLAIVGDPLFLEPIEKWIHGPVVPEVYHAYKKYGAGAIPTPKSMPGLDEPTKLFLSQLWAVYGQYSGAALRNFTHREPPWVNAQDGCEISLASMKQHFQTQLVKQEAK